MFGLVRTAELVVGRIDQQLTAAALSRLAEDGCPMDQAIQIDFFLHVPDRQSGEAASLLAKELGYKCSVEWDPADRQWTCYCSKRMVPELGIVVDAEEELDSVARSVGGFGDGFGTFGEP